MGHILKKMTLDNGIEVEEKGCSNYICRYCGGKATACNFVADMCLQVYARHNGICGAYVNNEKYNGYITECSTCKYHIEGVGCIFEEN
ncbi:MAG: hypothetical protein LUF92_12950 [Clostridiales bacterium]|nr:hypothetical protein [Clostridiales bacterium]